MHQRYDSITSVGANLGEKNHPEHFLSTYVNDLSLLNFCNTADMGDHSLNNGTPTISRQFYAKRVTQRRNLNHNQNLEEELYTINSDLRQYLERIPGEFKDLTENSHFYINESLNKPLFPGKNNLNIPRMTESCRSAYWKGKPRPKNKYSLRSIILLLLRWDFWWKLSKNLWNSKGKKFYSILFFILLCILPILCIILSLWSYFTILEEEWGKFPSIKLPDRNTKHIDDIKAVQALLRQLQNNQELIRLEMKESQEQFKNQIIHVRDTTKENSEGTLDLINSLTQKLHTLEDSLQIMRNIYNKDIVTDLNQIKDYISSQISVMLEEDNGISPQIDLEALAQTSFISDYISELLKKESVDIKHFLEDLIQSEISAVSSKINAIHNETIEHLNDKLLYIDKLNIHGSQNQFHPNDDGLSYFPWDDSNYNSTQRTLMSFERKISELTNRYLLDSTGQVDWALQSLGAKIVHSKTSSALNTDDWFESILNFVASKLPNDVISDMIKPMGKPPEVVLQPDVNPGQCFAFSGKRGYITIRLPATINVTSITLEHVHKEINNNIGSTPKLFKVYGIADPRWPDAFEIVDEGQIDEPEKTCEFKNKNCGINSIWLEWNVFWNQLRTIWNNQNQIYEIGDFYFDSQKRIQNYQINCKFPLHKITFEFLDNYGGEYTCIYRLRVHGNKIHRKSIL